MPSENEAGSNEDGGKFTHPVGFECRPPVVDNRNVVADSPEEAPIANAEYDVSRREDADGDSRIREEHADFHEDVGCHDETSSEATEDGDEMPKEVQGKEEKKAALQVDSSLRVSESDSSRKERNAKKREQLMEMKMHMKKAQAELEQKLEKKIAEDEMERLCDDLKKKLTHKVDAKMKEEEDFIPVSRPPSPDEEPDWMKELRSEDGLDSPPFFGPPNRGEASAKKPGFLPQALRRRRIRSYSLTETHCELGEKHIVTFKKFIGDPMDKYLETIGLVKRSIPQDGKSLYRCICEELFLCQTQEDIDFIKKWIYWIVELDYKVQRLRNGKENVTKDGNKDQLRAVAKFFRAKITVYKKPNTMPEVYDPPEGIEPQFIISVCELAPTFFERVIEGATAENLGVSQAAIYQAVIAQAYGLDKETIRHCIQRIRMEMGIVGNPLTVFPGTPPPSPLWIPDPCCRFTHMKFRPPVQYCKIKCMDPAIYRNIPCDLYGQELKQKQEPTEKKQKDIFPIGTSVTTKIRGVKLPAEVVADHDEKNKVLRFEDGAIGVVPTYIIQHDKDQKNQPPILLEHNRRPHPNVPSFFELPSIPPLMSSPVNYILEPLTWNAFPSPPPSPIYTAMPSPGIIPVVPMTQPFVTCSLPGHPMSMPPTPGSFPSCPVVPTIPTQRRYSVPEQIMANYSRFPLDPTFQAPPSPLFVQPSPIPVRPPSGHYATSQPISIPGVGMNSSLPLSLSPASIEDSIGGTPPFSPSPNALFFTSDEMKEVRKNSAYSVNTDGSDLPQDAATLRYYYNLGLSHANRRNGQTHDGTGGTASPSNGTPPLPGNFVIPTTAQFVYGMQPVPACNPSICGPVPASVMYSVPPSPVSPTYVNGTAYYYPSEVPAKKPEE